MTSSSPRTTRAVAYPAAGPIDAQDAFIDVEVEVGEPGPHDLLVEVRAVSVNPVDVKNRAGTDPGGTPRVLGFDAAGTVVAVGAQVSRFGVGDEVWYAGTIARSGSDAQLQLVDERIVGPRPSSLSFAEAAAMPLTAVTAWECMFDRLGLERGARGTLLVMGAAGGVGSMVIQLARELTDLRVLAAASRPESARWARDLGAHEVVDHRDLVAAVRAVSPDGVDAVISAFSSGNGAAFAELLPVHGRVVSIDSATGEDLMALKPKSQTWLWELMFSRPVHLPEDDTQHRVLTEVAAMVDAGRLRTTMTTRLAPISAATLTQAHRQVETSRTIGKVVLEGWD